VDLASLKLETGTNILIMRRCKSQCSISATDGPIVIEVARVRAVKRWHWKNESEQICQYTQQSVTLVSSNIQQKRRRILVARLPLVYVIKSWCAILFGHQFGFQRSTSRRIAFSNLLYDTNSIKLPRPFCTTTIYSLTM
jgi:hypothetical protein